MIKKIVVACAALVSLVFAAIPATAQARTDFAAPSCAAIHAVLPYAGDGNYLLNTGTHLVPVYCHDMAGVPREYVTLRAHNFSQYTAGGGAYGSSVRTTFYRVRIDPRTLTVNINDLTFAGSVGALSQGGTLVTSMPYGVAASCGGAPYGVGRIDLRGTAFQLASGFDIGGVGADGGAIVSSDDQVAYLSGGGFCGSITPAPHIFGAVNPYYPDFHLALTCAPYDSGDLLRRGACVTLG